MVLVRAKLEHGVFFVFVFTTFTRISMLLECLSKSILSKRNSSGRLEFSVGLKMDCIHALEAQSVIVQQPVTTEFMPVQCLCGYFTIYR